MKEINSAHEMICAYLGRHTIVKCAFCGAENRKRIDLNIDYAACSTCGKQLRNPMPRKKRILCGNVRCAGTIGSNSRCTYCGKTIAEGKNSINSSQGYPQETQRSRQFGVKKKNVPIAVFSCLLLVLYAYRDKLPYPNADTLPTNNRLSAAADRFEGGDAPLQVERRPFIFRSGSPPAIKDNSYYSDLLNDPKVNREDIIKLQRTLMTIGYEIGKPDGVISTKTISCFKNYCFVFGYSPKESFPDCFFKGSSFHYQIALDHKDWLDIYLTRDLENWIRALSDSDRKQISALTLDHPRTVVQLVRRYKFEKFKPIPASFPETGIIRKNYSNAHHYLQIKTRTENNNYYIKLVNQDTDQEILSAFIRSGSTLSVQVPPAVYELKYAAGQNWYGLEYLFGTSASYGKLPQPVVIAPRSRSTGAPAIDLIPSRRGKLTTDIISEYDF